MRLVNIGSMESQRTKKTLYLRSNHIKYQTMKEIIEKIQETYTAFQKDAELQVENGNKAAGTRARKASLELDKLMKEFRKASLEASKN